MIAVKQINQKLRGHLKRFRFQVCGSCFKLAYIVFVAVVVPVVVAVVALVVVVVASASLFPLN